MSMVIPNTPYDTASPSLMRARPACASAGVRAAQAAAGEQGEAGRASPRGAREALLAASGGAELYAALLCRFEPAGVLPFLQARPRCPAASRPPPGVVSAAVAACEADALHGGALRDALRGAAVQPQARPRAALQAQPPGPARHCALARLCPPCPPRPCPAQRMRFVHRMQVAGHGDESAGPAACAQGKWQGLLLHRPRACAPSPRSPRMPARPGGVRVGYQGRARPGAQAHDAYRVEAVLPATERYGVADARAFLLERLGDVAGALAIHVDAAAAANAALVDAALAGRIAPGALAGRRGGAPGARLLGAPSLGAPGGRAAPPPPPALAAAQVGRASRAVREPIRTFCPL